MLLLIINQLQEIPDKKKNIKLQNDCTEALTFLFYRFRWTRFKYRTGKTMYIANGWKRKMVMALVW